MNKNIKKILASELATAITFLNFAIMSVYGKIEMQKKGSKSA